MHGGLGNVVMHVWHVHECVMPAGTLPVHACSAQVRQGSNMMQCSARRRACVCIETVYDRHDQRQAGLLTAQRKRRGATGAARVSALVGKQRCAAERREQAELKKSVLTNYF